MRSLIPALRSAAGDGKWAWRLERLWLTPSFRRLARQGLPALAVVGAATWWLGDDGRMEALAGAWGGVVASVQDRPQFTVSMLSIEGASAQLVDDIEEAMPVDLPLSQFSLDPGAIRARLEELDPVARAEVRVAPGGVLAIRITERQPAVVWAHADGVDLLDAEGHRVATVPDVASAGAVPRVAGEGAGARVQEALRLVAAAAPVHDRLIGLERVGLRRWDVVLDGGQRILLPERAPARALDRAMALDAATGVLARDVTALDLRLPERPTLRLGEEGAIVLREARAAARAPMDETDEDDE